MPGVQGKASRTPDQAIARNCESGAISPSQAPVGQSADSPPRLFAQKSRDPFGHTERPSGTSFSVPEASAMEIGETSAGPLVAEQAVAHSTCLKGSSGMIGTGEDLLQWSPPPTSTHSSPHVTRY